MKRRDLVKFLAQKGVTFEEGGKHTKLILGNKVSYMPRHREISNNLVKVIKKQLGI